MVTFRFLLMALHLFVVGVITNEIGRIISSDISIIWVILFAIVMVLNIVLLYIHVGNFIHFINKKIKEP